MGRPLRSSRFHYFLLALRWGYFLRKLLLRRSMVSIWNRLFIFTPLFLQTSPLRRNVYLIRNLRFRRLISSIRNRLFIGSPWWLLSVVHRLHTLRVPSPSFGFSFKEKSESLFGVSIQRRYGSGIRVIGWGFSCSQLRTAVAISAVSDATARRLNSSAAWEAL